MPRPGRSRLLVLGAACLVGSASLVATAGVQLTNTGCAAAGPDDSCRFLGPSFGNEHFVGQLGPDASWSLSHLVKQFAVAPEGCTPRQADGSFATATLPVVDLTSSGPTAVLEIARPVLAGVTYTVSVTGAGSVTASDLETDTVANTGPTGAVPEVAEDRTQGAQPAAVCGETEPGPQPSPSETPSNDPTRPAATPGIACDKGSLPETGVQGDIPAADVASGRSRDGYTCNARFVSRTGPGGGFRVERYVDAAGHVCAYFDSGPLFPGTVHADGSGVWVLDMQDPVHPKHVASLTSPAMLSPHESLRLNQARGLLVANLGNPAFNAGFVDVYSVKDDCRAPVLQSSTPLGILGHESAFAPDGLTYYVNSTTTMMAAIDLADPKNPALLWTSMGWKPHGASISDDGNTMFMASYGTNGDPAGLAILDVSQIQRRVPNPVVTEISHLTWPEVSLPQNATPFRSKGHTYVIETDEFGGGSGPVGAARIINVDDLENPYVVSHIRLAVHNQNNSDKTAHYCTVPSRVDPHIIACGMLFSGLRVFDIRDVTEPREIAYANFTGVQNTAAYAASGGAVDQQSFGSVYSAPAFDPENNDIWYSDGTRGFFVVHLSKLPGLHRFAKAYALPGS